MEIEVKLKYTDRDEIVTWLKQNGFSKSDKKEIKDSYFGKKNESMSNLNSLYRLRNVVGELMELTLKDILVDENGVWTRRELNVSIDNSENMSEILVSLGCGLIRENFSEREIWKKDDVEFSFIDFSKPAELHIAEIEGPSQLTVHALIDDLGDKVVIAGEDVFAAFDKPQ